MADEFITPVHPVSEIEASAPPGNGGISATPRSPEFRVLPEIDNTNRYFKGQQKNEIVHCFCRKHWIVLLAPMIGFLLFIAIVIGFFSVSETSLASIMSPLTYRIIVGLGIIGMTWWFHHFFLRVFNYYLQTLIITNFRVIQLDQTLFFHRNRDSIDLPEIQDIVILQNGILKTLLNYGEIIITLSSAHATKTLVCVPNPEYYFRKINKTKREYITTRRVEKGKEPIT